MKVTTNLRGRVFQKTACLVLPAAFAIVCTVGVVAAPAFSLHATRGDLVVAKQEVLRLEELKARFLARSGRNSTDAVRNAKERLAGYVPEALSSLELHALIRAVGEAVGVELQSIAIGPFEDPGLERLGDYVGRRSVQLRAEGEAGSVTRLSEGLRRVGLPVAVNAFECAQGDDPNRWSMGLEFDVFERTTPPVDEGEGDYGDEEEPPEE